MVTLAQARTIALSFPETVEMDHHGFPSFRVRGKIFATNPTPERFNILLDEFGIRAALAAYPKAVEEFLWGGRLAAASLILRPATRDCVTDLLLQAWQRKAPKQLINAAKL
jgi:hypothetical protein